LIWNGDWVGQSTGIFGLEDQITERLASSIEPALTGAERKLLTKHYTENVEAYQLYMRGRYELRKRSEEGFTQGIKYFNEAVAKDPQYALAYAGLADSYLLLSVGDYGILAPREAATRAKTSANQALELDESLAEAHTSLGFLNYVFDWDWTNAEGHFRRAIELNPNYATAHHWYGLFLSTQGRANEGISELQRALQVDPRSPIINTDLGLSYYYADQYDQAITQLKKTLQGEPDFAVAHWRLGLTYAQNGQKREAEIEVRKALELSEHNPVFLSALGYVLAIEGKNDAARKTLDELVAIRKQRYVFPNMLANVYIALGEKDQALSWLERAYDDRCSAMCGLLVEPMYDSLRADARFQTLLKHLGFNEVKSQL
jgi:Tfp pilus assembly protein PilF